MVKKTEFSYQRSGTEGIHRRDFINGIRLHTFATRIQRDWRISLDLKPVSMSTIPVGRRMQNDQIVIVSLRTLRYVNCLKIVV